VTDDRDSFDTKRIEQIYCILREGDPTSITHGVVSKKSSRTKTSQIWRNRA
jgi:hypothetical protein